jgi:hypothetical protein
MANKNFTEKQREIIARKLGYKGPMSEFYKFIQSDPAMESKVRQLAVKLIAKGGYVQKFATGGTAQDQIESLYASILGRASDTGGKAYYESKLASGVPLSQIQAEIAASPEALAKQNSSSQSITIGGSSKGTTQSGASSAPITWGYTDPTTGVTTLTDSAGNIISADQAKNLTVNTSQTPGLQTITGPIHTVEKPTTTTTTTTGGTTKTPDKPDVPTAEVAKIPISQDQILATAAANAAAEAARVQAAQIAAAAEAAAREAARVEAERTQAAVRAEVAALQPAQGVVSKEAQIDPITMDPADTAIKKLEAEQGIATQVTGAPVRKVEAGELIESPAVDRAAVEQALAKNEAAQGIITEEMTVEGQLGKLLANFEANNPPVWAATSMRNATTVLAQRGLGASSLAGQAVIQATLEAALPIASADAAAYREMGLANLSNRQQMAVLTAQQRAAFLGQEFDQEFQRRAINAAKISDIANINFSAKQQIAIENARLTETMNLANLNNRQALVMAEAAQISSLELANLNNRQQAAVFNAQAFLQMDMANLANAQQTALFKSQAVIQSIMGDAAAENAARQFNAESQNQINTFYDGLNARIREFNAAQMNSMNQFNANQANSVEMFNAAAQNNRDQFNADFRRIIDQSNAEWRRSIATIDTAAQNNANMFNAQAALQINMAEYSNMWQSIRDTMEYAFKAGEGFNDRQNTLAIAVLQKQAAIEAAKFQLEGEKYKALGNLTSQILGGSGIATDIYSAGKGILKDIAGLFTGGGAGDAIDLSWLDDIESGLDLGGADLPDDYFDYDIYT